MKEKEYIKVGQKVIQEVFSNLYRKGDMITYKNETYTYHNRVLVRGDGECHDTIIKRKSDGKLFSFGVCYSGGDYFYEETLYEVQPKKVTKTIYE